MGTPSLDRRQLRELSSSLRRKMIVASDVGEAERLRNRIVEANMGLVHQVARRQARRYGFHAESEFDDVKSEVAATLVQSVEVWDPDQSDLGAVLWAASTQTIRRMRDLGTGWGQATGVRRRHARVQHVAAELRSRFGREPTDVEVSAESGVEVAEMVEMRERFGFGRPDVMVVADAGAAVAAEGESTLFVSEMAAMLSARDADVGRVFAVRFGLDGPPPPEPVPWGEVADAVGVSVTTAQRRVALGRSWVAEWLLSESR